MHKIENTDHSQPEPTVNCPEMMFTQPTISLHSTRFSFPSLNREKRLWLLHLLTRLLFLTPGTRIPGCIFAMWYWCRGLIQIEDYTMIIVLSSGDACNFAGHTIPTSYIKQWKKEVQVWPRLWKMCIGLHKFESLHVNFVDDTFSDIMSRLFYAKTSDCG